MKIIIPEHLKGLDYWGSKKIQLNETLSLKDAKLILDECPGYGIIITEDKPKEKPKRERK
jgi:hypothetical protein